MLYINVNVNVNVIFVLYVGGSAVVTSIADQYPDNVLGIHINFTPMPPPFNKGIRALYDIVSSHIMPSYVLDSNDQHIMSSSSITALIQETGYLHQQATKPQTTTIALIQSPVAILNWHLEKYYTGTDKDQHNDNRTFNDIWSYDDIIDYTMLYWATDTIDSAIQIYYNTFQDNVLDLYKNTYIDRPTAVSYFKYEASKLPRRMLQHYYNIKQYNVHNHGGHFAAWEVPNTLANDIYQFVTSEHVNTDIYTNNNIQDIYHDQL